jgi:hypothetical protein
MVCPIWVKIGARQLILTNPHLCVSCTRVPISMEDSWFRSDPGRPEGTAGGLAGFYHAQVRLVKGDEQRHQDLIDNGARRRQFPYNLWHFGQLARQGTNPRAMMRGASSVGLAVR